MSEAQSSKGSGDAAADAAAKGVTLAKAREAVQYAVEAAKHLENLQRLEQSARWAPMNWI
eukprot:4502003-Pyramimonas_sp.AAC.1